jgi:hypothetical protein
MSAMPALRSAAPMEKTLRILRQTLVASLGIASVGATAAFADTIVVSSPSYSCGAGVCTQSFDTGNAVTDWQGPSGNNTNPNLEVFQLNLFDPNLGTLTGVNLGVTFTTNITSGTLSNSSANSKSFTFSQDTAFGLATPAGNTALDTALAGLNIDPKYSGLYSIAGGGTIPLAGLPIVKAATGSLLAPPNSTSLFIGSPGSGGIQSLDGSTVTTDGISSGGGNISAAVTTDADAVISVTYDYTATGPVTPAPEPFSGALLGSALIGFGIVRRRFAS